MANAPTQVPQQVFDNWIASGELHKYRLNFRQSPVQLTKGTKVVKSFPLPRLPSSWTVMRYDTPIQDQQSLGSCTAFAATAMMENIASRNGINTKYSELFLYYTERVMIERRYPADDSGAYLVDTMTALCRYGNALEADWPYDITKYAVAPNQQSFSVAAANRVLTDTQVFPGLYSVKEAVSHSHPVVVAFYLTQNMANTQSWARTGVVPMPASGQDWVEGHAVLVTAYDDAREMFTFKNSWSSNWGVGGYGYLPYAMFSSTTGQGRTGAAIKECWTALVAEYDRDPVIIRSAELRQLTDSMQTIIYGFDDEKSEEGLSTQQTDNHRGSRT